MAHQESQHDAPLSLETIIAAVNNSLETFTQRIESRFDGLESRMGGMEEGQGRMENQLENISQRLENVETRWDQLEETMASIDGKLDTLVLDVGEIKNKIPGGF